MSNCNTYTGDLSLKPNIDNDWDINYFNGQPCMTDGFNTCITLAIFSDPDTWQNSLTDNPSEKYISTFPEVIKNGTVSNKTLNDGTASIKKALQFMTDDGMCESILVEGSIFSVYGIKWTINIIKGKIQTRYNINWDKGNLIYGNT